MVLLLEFGIAAVSLEDATKPEFLTAATGPSLTGARLSDNGENLDRPVEI
jgi:hypothetical protein